MNQDIVNSIVEGYKEKHRSQKVSMHELLRDPLFLSLPLDKQVEAVQMYSNVIVNTPPPSLSRIMTKSIISGAGAGLFASFPVVASMKRPIYKATVAATGAGLGAMMGAVSGKLMHSGDKARYENTNKYLIHLTKSDKPDIPNSVKVLDINRKYEPRTITSIVSKMISPERELINRVVGPTLKVNSHKLESPVPYHDSGTD